jgi:hypothetical protein
MVARSAAGVGRGATPGGMRRPIRKSTYRVSQCIEHDLPLPKGARKNVVDLVRYLCGTLTSIAEGHPINRINQLMPWSISKLEQACAAF